MSHFTEKEIEYLRSQRLGRVATVGTDGTPHVVPVVYTYNSQEDSIDIYGYNMGTSKKYRDVQKNGRAAFVVDDVLPPWEARGVEIRGNATTHEGAPGGDPNRQGPFIRLKPERIISWGLETEPYKRNSRKVAG